MLNEIFPTVPPYVLAAAVLHLAFFLALIIPLWRIFGRAGLGGPWALVLLLPAIGLIAIPIALVASVLRRAGWSLAWAVLTIVPLLNVIFVWIFAFAHWPAEARPARVYAGDEDRPRVGGLESEPEPAASAAAEPTLTRAEQAAAPEEPARPAETAQAAAGEEEQPLELERANAVNRKRTQPVDDRTIRAGAETAEDAANTRPVERKSGRLWLMKGANPRSADISLRITEADLKDADEGLLIGRSSRADFILTDDSVSRNHARLTLRGDRLFVEDLDSMNGTWIDGHKLEPGEPRALDRDAAVEFGQMKLIVSEG